MEFDWPWREQDSAQAAADRVKVSRFAGMERRFFVKNGGGRCYYLGSAYKPPPLLNIQSLSVPRKGKFC